MNLLLLLTALLTSLTGMMSGDRAATPRAPAAAITATQGGESVQAVRSAVGVRALTMRPAGTLPTLRDTNVPLIRAFALVPVLRLTAEKRRE